MSRIYFEDLPSRNTPRIAENLNKLNNVIISSTEQTTGEEVWFQKGKNLFDKNNMTIADWQIGSSTHTIFANSSEKSIIIKVKPDTTYTISKLQTNRFRYGEYPTIPAVGDTLNNYKTSSNGTTITATTLSTTNYIIVNIINISESYDLQSTLDSIQIEVGSSATSYEPYIDKKIYTKNDNGVYEEFYQEVKADSFKDEEVVVGSIRSKNMLGIDDGTYTSNGYTVVVENGKFTINGTGTATPATITIKLIAPITIKANEIYTLSLFNPVAQGNTGETGDYFTIRLGTTDASNIIGTTFGTINNTKQYSRSSDITLTQLQIRGYNGGTLTDFVATPQLEEGSSSTQYRPYQKLDTNIHTLTGTQTTDTAGKFTLNNFGKNSNDILSVQVTPTDSSLNNNYYTGIPSSRPSLNNWQLHIFQVSGSGLTPVTSKEFTYRIRYIET